MVEVVSAVIIEWGRILLTQRPRSKDFPLCWESPGGKVQNTESHGEALRRELVEEIGVEVWKIEDPFDSHKIERPGQGSVNLFLYRVHLRDVKKASPLEGQGIGWFSVREFDYLELTPGNKLSRRLTREMIQKSEARGA